ncbi:TlpA family protein disulfide reductase [Halarcobacter ebronensis]|uniref:Thioredoxin n=1 Tax=Halarcobacter ebronensis TaxID=1462615 RepID=A0A4Q1ANT2_9BACT|nr:TlpA disulfide reductase family protein [Halarcobacter ebronensis]QKF82432.1 protein disulfide reductase, TlpA family [Halarcobacter ebronensis]RXK07547.1 thioredoxin [Halarcobacter ebronensis]
MQFKKLTFLLILIILVVTGCDSKKETVVKEQTKFQISSQLAPQLTLEKNDIGIDFKELKGKVILLNFFATWCPPCKAEIPHLIRLKDKYKDNFEIVALNMGEENGTLSPQEKVNAFINDYMINYHVSNSKENFKISDIMGNVRVIPTMFLFDTTGKIVQKYVGIVPEEMMETDIKKALGI